MKAVILNLCPEVVIVDVTHEVAKFDVRMGAFLLASAAPYFPKDTIHVAVIDPGVGTSRRCLIVQTKRGFLVGPDNGVLALAGNKERIVTVREITNTKCRLPQISSTFHGRDIFAPTAAQLASGVQLTDFGAEVRDMVRPKFSEVRLSNGKATGEILYVDGFGNIVTNLGKQTLVGLKAGNSVNAIINRRKLKMKICKTYAEAQPNESLVLMGSQGYLEIAKNQGNACDEFKAKPGDKVTISTGN
jgi:S-adenosylmethionine hydrolase